MVVEFVTFATTNVMIFFFTLGVFRNDIVVVKEKLRVINIFRKFFENWR
jgi:hypothetical protein